MAYNLMKTAHREILMSERAEEHGKLSSASVDVNEWPDFTKEECQGLCHLMNVNFFIPRGMPVGQEALKMSMGFGYTAAKRARNKALKEQNGEAFA